MRSAALLLAAGPLFAAINNDWPKVGQDCAKIAHPPAGEAEWKQFMACGTDFFTARPIHLTVQSIVAGGGFGVGPTFSADFNSDKWQQKLTMTGVASFRDFWTAGAKFTSTHDRFGRNNSARDRFAIKIYANAHDLPKMPYYGIGPNTATTNLVDFGERDVIAGATVSNPFSQWFVAGAGIESIWPDIREVTEPGVISIGSRFTEATAPGLASQPNLVHYSFFVEPRRGRHAVQFDYKIAYNYYQDTAAGRYSFKRFTVDGTHPFHPTRNSDLIFRDRLSLSSDTVPFYMQETLGGSDINGQPSLRGFADYRFRARDLMLIQAEYDYHVWGPLGVIGFYDTGMVANNASDLSFSDLRHSFGFGLAVYAANRAVFKVYVGLGSGEGHHTFIGIPAF